LCGGEKQPAGISNMPNKLYSVNALVLDREDKYFIIRAPSLEVAEKIVELWNKE